ncbi:MAG TPA: amidohydrolase family protein [Steroidobacter sp.]|nr:amidohydrolase family protein [Steroidobacter sp.]
MSARAETIVVKNVSGSTPSPQGIQTFSGLVVVDGKVDRLLASSAAPPSIPHAKILDGGGRTLLPGLIDAHGHILELGRQRTQADLRGATSLAAALERVRTFAASNSDQPWILGRGWNQALWPEKRFPTARDLDAVVRDRPVVLTRIDGHAIWANSAAMKAAGISALAKGPEGGQIVRDGAGEPTGVFVDAAMPLIERHAPAPTDEQVRRALRAAMRELASLGVTSVHDAGVDEQQYRAYQQLGAAGELPIRIYAMLQDSEAARPVIATGPKPSQFDDRLQLRAVKAWVDGALGSRGAALLKDYGDQPHHRGFMLYSSAQLGELAAFTASKGWQLNLHAIGDAGNRAALDAFATHMTQQQRSALRPRIEHAQVIAPEDAPRFAELGVIASIQPTHATSDMNMAEDRLGRERLRGAYAWRTLLDSGARLAGGSDFPVELPNPFYGLYAAVTRQDREGRPPGGWHASEKLSREEALRLFTLDAAYAAHMEGAVGSLEPGKWADFILVDRDYFKIPESEIDDVRVIAAYVAGAPVFRQ